jgi:hypothetical protein
LDVQGAMEDRWLVGLQRYRLGAEGHLSSLEVRANLYDDVPARPASDEIARRRLEGYDLQVGAPLPFLSGGRVHASRSWQVAVNGETVTADRVGFSSNSLLGLEIETDATGQPEERAWVYPAALARQARQVSLPDRRSGGQRAQPGWSVAPPLGRTRACVGRGRQSHADEHGRAVRRRENDNWIDDTW